MYGRLSVAAPFEGAPLCCRRGAAKESRPYMLAAREINLRPHFPDFCGNALL